jgi:hypothetical protein
MAELRRANMMDIHRRKKEEAEVVKMDSIKHEKMIRRQREIELERAGEVIPRTLSWHSKHSFFHNTHRKVAVTQRSKGTLTTPRCCLPGEEGDQGAAGAGPGRARERNRTKNR